MVAALRARHEALLQEGGFVGKWRALQFDAVSAFIVAQRVFVQLHSEIVHVLQSDKALYARLRLESIELASNLTALRDLIREIEKSLSSIEYP